MCNAGSTSLKGMPFKEVEYGSHSSLLLIHRLRKYNFNTIKLKKWQSIVQYTDVHHLSFVPCVFRPIHVVDWADVASGILCHALHVQALLMTAIMGGAVKAVLAVKPSPTVNSTLWNSLGGAKAWHLERYCKVTLTRNTKVKQEVGIHPVQHQSPGIQKAQNQTPRIQNDEYRCTWNYYGEERWSYKSVQ